MRIYLYIALLMLLNFSCRENEIYFDGPYHVRFTELEDSELESYSQVIPISVHLAGPHMDQSISISYIISGTAREGKDFEIIGNRGEVLIQRGKSFGYINLKLINNSNNILETSDIVFTLESVTPSTLDLGYGEYFKIGKSMTFTIIDDCILGGTYTGFYEPIPIPINEIRISSRDCITYTLANWDINIDLLDYQLERNLIFYDNGDNTLTIPVQEELTIHPDSATIRGSGVVNPVTREITFKIQLVDFTGSPEVTVKYTPE